MFTVKDNCEIDLSDITEQQWLDNIKVCFVGEKDARKTTFTVKDNCELELLDAIEQQLGTLWPGAVKSYFAGEEDTSKTKFEELSVDLKIGVLAPNETTGLVLLRLLRIIIDENSWMLREDCFQNFEAIDDKEVEVISNNGNQIEMKKIIERLAEKEKEFMSSFDIDERPIIDLYGYDGSYQVTNTLDKIDIWTLPRIMNEIKKLY